MTNNFEIWIGDFAYATRRIWCDNIWGSWNYNAPEVTANKQEEEKKELDCSKQDSFTLGVVLFGLIGKVFPFTEASSQTQYWHFITGEST